MKVQGKAVQEGRRCEMGGSQRGNTEGNPEGLLMGREGACLLLLYVLVPGVHGGIWCPSFSC